MKRKKILCLAAAALLMLTGCTKIEQQSEEQPFMTATATTQLDENVQTTAVTKHQEVALEIPEITQQEATLLLEAEEAAIPEGCSVSVMPRLGYSGTGYISGLSSYQENQLTLTTEIPATQHYDMTIVIGSEDESTCRIFANDELVYTLNTEKTENFVRVKIPGVFLSEGECTLSIQTTKGAVDVDCIELCNNETLYNKDETITAQPVDAKATASAKELLSFLSENYGKKTITGQFVSDSSNEELEQIYEVTGKYPLIRFADMGAYSRNGGNASEATAVADSLDWAEKGGIVGLSWLWNAPTGNGTIYDKETAFDLSATVTSADIAKRSSAELESMVQNGEITQGCLELVMDIDAVSKELKTLADADIPVLWRPLPEAGGGWYWWGAHGAENYNWLWNLLYERMTEYHQLHNLLWVWNGQSSSYLVDESTYDIASLDLYVDKEEVYGSRYEQFIALRDMTGSKLLALSECSTVPDMNAMFRDNAVWSYFGLWYGQYLNEYTSEEDLITIYNSEGTLTLGDYSS